MSGNHYWTPRDSRHPERRSSDGDQPIYNTPGYTSMYSTRSPSAGSSPTGMVSPSMARSDLYNTDVTSVQWASNPSSAAHTTSVFPPEVTGDMQYPTTYLGAEFPGTSSPGSVTPFPNSPFHSDTFDPSFVPDPNSSVSTFQPSEEIRQLRAQITEFEQRHRRDKERIHHLQAQLLASNSPPPPSEPFKASWRARTEARIRQFCSLNRAGNALCAWHDSRRERRIYPPRMAPPGYLNCGCSYEEALFEESLARHRVGSYLPGDCVRMDPALRNPLLKLLQERYGYRDGDFERDPRTGNWIPGEGHAKWEEQISRGIVNPRRPRADQNR
ncbi:hypothetical protein K435DRAFT_798680 [Dendrothele bispora CBS 962.96]|uniref:Uncharacterized protein n=1 Tax=Dendrothele bispora (strain CBS 962.96) TaxID=1314807 RepID=A0A4V6T5D8_DENBC|nr:hypothetical protein K435DRAFT_798680 [Dendrothele bispora CBS 962.96]